jgi:cytochrome c551/c552
LIIFNKRAYFSKIGMYFCPVKSRIAMSNCRNVFKSYFLLFLLSAFLPVVSYAYTPASLDGSNADHKARYEEGKKLFKANCAACHAVDRKMTGPALKNVWERWESQEKIISWTRNSQALIASGDAYANQLFNEWNKSVMSAFPQLSDDQIINILEYYVQGESLGSFAATTAGPTDPTQPVAEKGGSSKGVLYAVVAFLLFITFLLWRITSKLDRFVQEKQGAELAPEKSIGQVLFSKKTVSVLLIIGVVLLGFNVVKGAIDLGRSQGYAPEQPIKFSHAIHAGQNKIDCQYCHTGVEKSKHAVIPSATVCMNCHKYVQEGPQYGTTEIAKIYEHTGWDPEAGAFTKEPKPLEWVKIHNLPDHVYFNHAQHVKVGGLECQSCHGNVEEMEVVQQFAPLSMGWCINCHRQSEVQFASNNYYSIFEKFHDELKKGDRANVTVEDIGGTECAKCHY